MKNKIKSLLIESSRNQSRIKKLTEHNSNMEIGSIEKENTQIKNTLENLMKSLDIYYIVYSVTYKPNGDIISKERRKFDCNDLIPIKRRIQAIEHINKTLISFSKSNKGDNQKLSINLLYFPHQKGIERMILDISLNNKGITKGESMLTKAQIFDNLEVEYNDYNEYFLEKENLFRIRNNGEGILNISLSV